MTKMSDVLSATRTRRSRVLSETTSEKFIKVLTGGPISDAVYRSATVPVPTLTEDIQYAVQFRVLTAVRMLH